MFHCSVRDAVQTILEMLFISSIIAHVLLNIPSSQFNYVYIYMIIC